MPGFLDFLREALGGIAGAATRVQQGQQSQNPLVAGLSGLAGVPFQALQLPQAVLGNYLEKFRAPGIENRRNQIAADTAAAALATSREGQAVQFNPPPGYSQTQGQRVAGGARIPFRQLPEAHKMRLRLLAERLGQPTDDTSLEMAWEGATNIPSNLPPPVLTKDEATIQAAQANAAKDLAAADALNRGQVGAPYPGMVPLEWNSKGGVSKWGYPPPAVQVPGPGPADAPALNPSAPRPPAPAPTGDGAPALDRGAPRPPGPAAKPPPKVIGKAPAAPAPEAAAPAPDTSFDPRGKGADAADDMPALPGPRPVETPDATGAPSAAPAPAPAAAAPAPAPAPAPAAAPPVIPPPPGLPSAAPAPVVPSVLPPGGMSPAAGPASAAPGTAPAGAPPAAAPSADPEADAAEERLEPGASQRPLTGFPSGAFAEPGAAAGALVGSSLAPGPQPAAPPQGSPSGAFVEGAPLAGEQLAQTDTGRTGRVPGIDELGGAQTPRGAVDVIGEVEKPATFGWTWPDRYYIALDHDTKLYDYVASRGFRSTKEARNDQHVQGLMHDWWTKEDLRVKTAQQIAATQGKANAAVQRQLGSIMAMENALDFIERDLGGKPKTSGLDVPVSLEWSNASDWLNKMRDEIPLMGAAAQETFSASGVGPPWTSPRWYSVRQMSKDPNHPWAQQAARLMTMEGTAGLGVRSLGDVGTMTDREKEIFANAYIPQPQDTPELRREKVQIVRELLRGVRDGMMRGTLTTPEKVREYMRERSTKDGRGMTFEAGPGTGPTPEEREPGPVSGRRLERQPTATARRLTSRRVA